MTISRIVRVFPWRPIILHLAVSINQVRVVDSRAYSKPRFAGHPKLTRPATYEHEGSWQTDSMEATAASMPATAAIVVGLDGPHRTRTS
jgi:hypothetical protein